MNFLREEKPLLLDFYADWCGPCKVQLPILEELDQELSGDANIVKVNIDENRELAAHFAVRSVPSIFIIQNKKVLNQFNGVQNKVDLKAQLLKLIKTEIDA